MKKLLLNSIAVTLASSLVAVLALSFLIPVQAQINRNNNFSCDQSVAVSISTATTTRIVQNDSTADNPTKIYICGYSLTLIGTATANAVTFEYGTGATCGTGTTVLSGPLTSDATAGVMKFLFAAYPFKAVPVLNNLCVLTTQAGVVSGNLTYSVF